MAVCKNYMWRVNVSSFEHLKFGESKASRKFITVWDHISCTWCLKIYPKGLRGENSDFTDFCIAVVYLAGPQESVFASNGSTFNRTTISICANPSWNGTEIYVGGEYFFPASIPPNYLIQNIAEPDSNGNHSLDFTLTLTLQADMFTNQPFPSVLEPTPFHSNDRLLLKVLSGEEDKFSDFSIIADKHIYATDRRILASRCDYFHELFVEGGEDWIEKTTKQLSAPVGKRAMDEILTYIYTDRVNIPQNDGVLDVELIEELVCGSDYFRLPDLKKYYERPLYKNLVAKPSNKSALSTLIFADRYGFKALKSCALSVLEAQYDSIEEYVTTIGGLPGKQKSDSSEKEDEILVLLKTLKQSRPGDKCSLFDELFAFMRQSYVTQL